MAAWHDYEALTQGLAQELCEQLRLVLEPSQATKLKQVYSLIPELVHFKERSVRSICGAWWRFG